MKKTESAQAEPKTATKKVATVRIRLLQEILGSQPSDKKIYERFIKAKAPETVDSDSQADCIEEAGEDEKGKTVFPKDENGNPILFTYQVKGFFKAAWKALWKLPGTYSSAVKAGVSKIDRSVFIYGPNHSMEIPFENAVFGEDSQRPLRAETAQGPRVSLACSERIKSGVEAEFSVELLDSSLVDPFKEWLAYGKFCGLGQWRNSGRGSFEVVSLTIDDAPMFELIP